ncbi:MAG: phosphoadenylyl-sulfate reductase [Acetobacteraceae bacterium]|nr:phosphoadenylyl-sulfate reductase [Acetobacteraceae bacterium]
MGPFSLAERVRHARALVAGRLVLTTSFGIEDQLLTHTATTTGVDIDIVTLDTGRLFPETYDVWAETERRYGIRIRAFTPDPRALEPLVARIGINGFRDSVENRHACCHVRKVDPLGRALAGADGWVSGLRASQSSTRSEVQFLTRDSERDVLRIHPLFDWTRARVVAALRAHAIPYNRLEDVGMLSIGCQPCTRAVRPGENERAGRWWWEQESARECGLHVGPDGRLVRVTGRGT